MLKIYINYLEITLQLPILETSELISTSIPIPTAFKRLDSFLLYIKHLHQNFFLIIKCEENVVNSDMDELHIKFCIWKKIINDVITWIELNHENLLKMKALELNVFVDVIFDCLYWPLTQLIDKNEVSFVTII